MCVLGFVDHEEEEKTSSARVVLLNKWWRSVLGDLRGSAIRGVPRGVALDPARMTRHGDRARVRSGRDASRSRVPGSCRSGFAAARLGDKKTGRSGVGGRELRTGLSPFLRVANSSADSIILTILEPWGWG